MENKRNVVRTTSKLKDKAIPIYHFKYFENSHESMSQKIQSRVSMCVYTENKTITK